jgi:ribosome-associated protein
MAKNMIKVSPTVFFDGSELEFIFVRSQGPGGQNVNKVASAVQLRFNVFQSKSLPEEIRARLLLKFHNRLTHQGELIIKASRYRTQERNKQDALNRLIIILKQAAICPKKRKKTKPTKTSVERRLQNKKKKGQHKSLRTKPINHF